MELKNHNLVRLITQITNFTNNRRIKTAKNPLHRVRVKKTGKIIEVYQCPGCVCGHNIKCFKKDEIGIGCGAHVAGTNVFPLVGRLFLGMPKGFNRVGPVDKFKLSIFEDYENMVDETRFYDELNIPVWKCLDEHGNTLIRGLSPRINTPFLHIILGNNIDKIDCFETKTKMLNQID